MVDDQRHLVAIASRLAHADRFANLCTVQSADSPKRFLHDPALPLELCGITQLLELAPAAGPEDRAKRSCARWRFAQNFHEICDRIARFYFAYPNASELAGNRAKAKNHSAVGAADALAVGKKICERELEFDALAQRRGEVRRCFFARQAP